MILKFSQRIKYNYHISSTSFWLSKTEQANYQNLLLNLFFQTYQYIFPYVELFMRTPLNYTKCTLLSIYVVMLIMFNYSINGLYSLIYYKNTRYSF